MIDTVFHYDDTPIRVSHDCCTDPVGRTEDGLLVRSASAESDTLSTITIGPHENLRKIYVFWSLVTTGEHFDLLYVPDTQTLFVGGGSHSASIDTATMSIIQQNDITLFWAFERRRQFVLELGELECFLYDLHGKLIDEAPVDPPYEINETDGGINLVSIVVGSQWLTFPA
ncbi:hypothetical protein RISK_004482 [Rhodopirellula islandica]|uniref:Uncharacterized protein n=1 Tax=Rhodopirellula islandica TaxID=595434 RepID=A0A0J1BAE2_RHOIS|nr:hypothetical protein [Rhodopirellula islandica]KLU03478.1 hypothetical protein RISK_004482 [Rhodopirellula islandica]